MNCLHVLSRSVEPEETVRLGKDGSGMVMVISSSGRQWKSSRQKDLSVLWLSDAGILIPERSQEKKRALVILVAVPVSVISS